MMLRPLVLVSAATFAISWGSTVSANPLNSVTVDLAHVVNLDAPLILGMSMDARSSFFNPSNPANLTGYYDRATGGPLPIATQWESEWSQVALRYPQGPVNVWEWKKTVGPIAQRTNISNLGQKAAFGLQEFLDMTERNGTNPADITMMVNLYGSGGYGNPSTAQAVQDAGDLVAYLNKPWDGLPFGGANYEALRAQSHGAPYAIRYFSLGNEPWNSSEFSFLTTGDPNPANDGALRYAALAQQFIAAMRAVDANVRITLAGPSLPLGAAALAKAHAWNNTLMQQLGTQINGIVTNTYYEFEPGDLVQRGVQKVGNFMDQVSTNIAAYDAMHGTQLKHIIGEHGNVLDFNYSTNPPTLLDTPDFNMNYQSAVTTADYLMMVSTMASIERAHHFMWGNTLTDWRPIRSDVVSGQTIYTILPPADLYRRLDDFVLAQSVGTTTASVAGSDGETYAVRGGAFRSMDGTHAALVLVNRDPAVDQTIQVSGLGGHAISAATLMTGDSAGGFTTHFDPFPFTPAQTSFDLPHLGVLMLEYQSSTADVASPEEMHEARLTRVSPNPVLDAAVLGYALPRPSHVELALFDVSGRRLRTFDRGVQPAGDHRVEWDGRDDAGRRIGSGVYLLRLDGGGVVQTARVIVLD